MFIFLFNLRCIFYCINDPSTYIFDNFLLLEPIKYLEGELIHNVFLRKKIVKKMY
jgi:hypothetical protein